MKPIEDIKEKYKNQHFINAEYHNVQRIIEQAIDEAYALTSEVGGCEWREDEISEYYDTGCGDAFMFIDGSKEHDFKYCPYCGKKIKEITNE